MKKIALVMISLAVTSAVCAAGPARHPSFEPVEIPAAAHSGNLLLNARATASGQWSDHDPSRAVNGNRNPGDHWACENLPVWHQSSLENPTEMSAIRIWPYWGDGRIYQYKIEGSADGSEWTLLGDMTANSIASDAEGTLFTFDPIAIRHVRTTFLGNSRGAQSGGHIVQIEGCASPPVSALGGGIGTIGTIDTRYPLPATRHTARSMVCNLRGRASSSLRGAANASARKSCFPVTPRTRRSASIPCASHTPRAIPPSKDPPDSCATHFTRELLDERRAAGRKTTFYVCTSPPVPNTFTFSPPAESEWLPLFASARGFDGFLRWAYHSWVENPLVSTDFTPRPHTPPPWPAIPWTDFRVYHVPAGRPLVMPDFLARMRHQSPHPKSGKGLSRVVDCDRGGR